MFCRLLFSFLLLGSTSSFGILGDFMSNISPPPSSPPDHLLSRTAIPSTGGEISPFFNKPCEPHVNSPLNMPGSRRSQYLEDQSQLLYDQSSQEPGPSSHSQAIDNLLKLSLLNSDDHLQQDPMRQQLPYSGWGEEEMNSYSRGLEQPQQPGRLGKENKLSTSKLLFGRYYTTQNPSMTSFKTPKCHSRFAFSELSSFHEQPL